MNGKNKAKKILSAFLILSVMLNYVSVNPLAALINIPMEGKYKYENSTGSSASDYTTNDTPTGRDNTQGVESAYKHIILNNDGSDINNYTSETEVYATRAPNFSVKIPKTVILDANGFGEYDVGIKGDISGSQKLIVKPIDEIPETDTVDFYMHEQYAFVDSKADISAVINQTKTLWTFSEINLDNYSYLTDAGTIQATAVSAGSWAGTFNFEIQIGTFEVASSKYFSIDAPGLVTIEIITSERREYIKNIQNTYNISCYAASVIDTYSLSSDSGLIAAAQESDAAFDEYFNANILDTVKENEGVADATNVDDVYNSLYGFTFHDIEKYIETNELPNGYNPIKNYTGKILLCIAHEYSGENPNRSRLPSDLVLPTNLFGYRIDGLFSDFLEGCNEIEYLYIPSTYTCFAPWQFNGCQAKEIVIRSTHLTDFSAEYFKNNTYLEIITLPSNISELPEGAFSGCTNLKQVFY